MEQSKRERLEKVGWSVGNAEDFLKVECKYKSPDEIRIALKLKPWDEWRLAQIKFFLSREAPMHSPEQCLEFIDSKRATGRTTKMLVEAVYAAQMGKVLILGHSDSYSQSLVNIAHDMCFQIGLKELIKNIQPMYSDKVSFIDKTTKLFQDHYTRG